MKLKNLMLSVLFATTFSAVAQEIPMNNLTVDGKTYNLQGEKPMTYTEKKGEWSLYSEFTGKNGEKGAMNIRTKGKFFPSGNYPMAPNLKNVPDGSVSYSISIAGDPSLGMFGYKQYTSTDKGTAVIKYEDGIYSFEFVGVGGINIRSDRFLVDANMTFDPNAHKTRKELNKENNEMNMSQAWINEAKYFISQSQRFSTFNDMNKENPSAEIRDKMKETIEKMIESNEEILKILARPTDNSISESEIIRYKTISTTKTEQLLQTKKEIKKSINNDIMTALIIGLTRGAKE